jgi:hypothetical protein
MVKLEVEKSKIQKKTLRPSSYTVPAGGVGAILTKLSSPLPSSPPPPSSA